MAITSPSAQVPQAPASSAVSSKAQDQFIALKRSLSDIASWELAAGTVEELPLAFSEGGHDLQANVLVSLLKK